MKTSGTSMQSKRRDPRLSDYIIRQKIGKAIFPRNDKQLGIFRHTELVYYDAKLKVWSDNSTYENTKIH